MRHLELTFGPEASKYQNTLGLQLKSTPPPTTQPPPPTLPPASKMDVIYLCNSKDPQCKPHIVYLPTGGVPVLCDPRYHPNCKLSPVQKLLSPPVTASDLVTSAPSPPQKSTPPPPPPPSIIKGMKYDCDPYWDPDCLIDNPPRPVKMIEPPPALPAEKVKKETGNKVILNAPVPTYDPYDFNQDLYDPFRHAAPAPWFQIKSVKKSILIIYSYVHIFLSKWCIIYKIKYTLHIKYIKPWPYLSYVARFVFFKKTNLEAKIKYMVT